MYLEPPYCRYDATAKHLYFALPWRDPIVRVRSWHEGCRVDMEEGGGWNAQIDAIDLPVASDLLTGGDSGHPIASYARELPQTVVRGIAPFTYGQLAMLQVCAASPRGEQLLRSAPALFWLIAPELLRRSGAEPEALHALLGMRQRDLLTLLCGQGNKTLIRLLAKVPLPTMVYASPQVLTAILAREEASSLLRHKRIVDWPLLELIARQGDKISDPLVRDILMSDRGPSDMASALGKINRLVCDTGRLGWQLGIADAMSLVAACTDFQRLSRLHDAWTERLNSMNLDAMARKLGNELPPPPLPGTNAIQPICSVRELLAEGMTMRHCAGSYVDAVRAGESYIYRVTEPVRATLEIRKNKAGAWEQKQMKTYRNGNPGAAATKRVQEWLLEDGWMWLGVAR